MSSSYFSNDTIAAVATSLAGDGGVGIIRISGSNALKASQKISTGLEVPEPRYLQRIFIKKDDEVIDDGVGVYFPEGHSFTGEEVVELQIHGGRFLLQTILNLLISTGLCRIALPGEFSFRSVRNGKNSLSGAQAVQQIVASRSLFEVKTARKSLSEKRVAIFDDISRRLHHLLAQTELSIDFMDQDVEVISDKGLISELSELLEFTKEIELQMNAAKRIARGIQVTLFGKPNAGKSTLFNALLGEDRAIVSKEEGTTRDVITEDLTLGQYRIRLADTAGLRENAGFVETVGIEKAKDTIEASDIILLLIDATATKQEVLEQIAKHESYAEKRIVLFTKMDLVDASKKATLDELASNAIFVSANDPKTITQLIQAVKKTLDQRYHLGINTFLPTEFQLQMITQCRDALSEAHQLVKLVGQRNPEILSVTLHSAAKAISDLVGETTPDTILNKIFSEFCIGK